MGDFDKIVNRVGTESMKWDGVDKLYGGEGLLPFWVADMDFKAPEAVLEALKKRVDHGIFGYPHKPASLDDAIINWLSRRYSFPVDQNEIVYTSGVVPAIYQIIQAFTKPKDKVIIQPPVYYPFFKVVTNGDRQLVENPLVYDGQHYKMDLDHLESIIDDQTKMIILCSPHNPVGRVWSKEELTRLAELCIKYNLLIIADEIHADLIFSGHTHTSIATLSEEMANRTFTCLAPSKTFNLAGIQASYVVIKNQSYKRKLEQQLGNEFLNMTNNFSSVAMEAAYRYGESWLEELLQYLENNVATVKQNIQEFMPKIKVVEPEGTYLLWLDCTDLQLSSMERKKWLRDSGKLALSHGIVFGKEGEAFERVNIACPKQTLVEGLERLKKAYDEKF